MDITIKRFRLEQETNTQYRVYFTFKGVEHFIGYWKGASPTEEKLLGNSIGDYSDVIRKWETSENSYRTRIGYQLMKRRREKGLTQDQLSKMTGYDRANIAKIENGKYNVGIDIIGKIADALGVEITLINKNV